jgi:hypothetical protein
MEVLMWVGEMIADIKQEILLVTEIGKEEEGMVRLSRMGYDHTIGYLNSYLMGKRQVLNWIR